MNLNNHITNLRASYYRGLLSCILWAIGVCQWSMLLLSGWRLTIVEKQLDELEGK